MKIIPKAADLHGEVNTIDPKERALQNATKKQSPTIVDALKKEEGDKAEISNLGAALQQLKPSQILEERKAKIESIKEQIKNGTYNPPLEDVAQSLIDEVSSEILYTGGLGPVTEN